MAPRPRITVKWYRCLFFTAVFLFLIPGIGLADTIGQIETFNVNSKYDQFSRTSLSATLRNVSANAYFYVEDRYWDNLNPNQRTALSSSISALGQEFDSNIYPKETQFWGAELNPGIDNDPKITILLEDLISGNGGYFDTSNQYSKNIVSSSNEREMIVVDIQAGNFAKNFLGHEFQHLIAYNQKEVLRKVQEDVWLNELRSEYSVSLLGYNDIYSGSGLENRVRAFVENPSDSLTEWPNVSADYAQVALFGEYVAEQFSQSILNETLQDLAVGISSIDQFLQRHNYPEKFSNLFENWTVANYLNNISLDSRYGYQRDELKTIHVTPDQSFLVYPSPYTFNYSAKPWQSTWHKYNFSSLPSNKAIKINYSTNSSFRVLYVDNLGRVGVLSNPGYITNPGGLNSIVLMPINETETTGFGTTETLGAISLNINYVDNALAKTIPDGALIKKPVEPETYVTWRKYKRYLRPEVIKLYGQLDSSRAVEVDNEKFFSYTSTNYVRNVNQQKVYAVWPDGTKHWINITPQQWDASGRDWNAIFIINDLELNYYKTGADITR